MNNVIGLVDGVATHLDYDGWVLVQDDQDLSTESPAILTLERWKNRVLIDETQTNRFGVLLSPDNELEEIAPWVDKVPMIALQFPSFRDGRAYSQANLLRTRYQFKGDLRAVGDVLRDQLVLMRHCGFSSFAVREDKSVLDALKGLVGFDFIYARSVTTPEPLYRRRSSESS